MKVMILAAGRGERMRPLTDHTPKPLLPVAGRPMIEYTIETLVDAGFDEIIINLSYLGGQIKKSLGDGQRFGVSIRYSDEGDSALETAGGIQHALPLLGDQAFAVVNGDIACEFDYASLLGINVGLAHLVLIPNPPHHPQGDFSLDEGILNQHSDKRYTFSGIGLYHPELFAHYPPGKLKLVHVLKAALDSNRVTGELFKGFWLDVGNQERRRTREKDERQKS